MTTQTYTIREKIGLLFHDQQQYAPILAQAKVEERREKLNRILQFLRMESNIRVLSEAIYKDFKKNETEFLVTEIGVLVSHIQFVRKKLKRWMSKRRVGAPIELLGTSSYCIFEPKGSVLIIAPWNYPLLLSVLPVVYAISAGNTVILKPSEISANTSSAISAMLSEMFDHVEVAVVEGGAEVSKELLKLPFNHIYFTGSPDVGRTVMAAAARHLASVTLELGSKSPAIVDGSADIQKIARRMAWAKFINAGQTCIAPDYAMVHESVFEKFIDAAKTAITDMYDPHGRGTEHSPDFCRIINAGNYNRLSLLLDDALDKGARVLTGGHKNAIDRYIAPTLLTGVHIGMKIMQEEIFGPLLPVLSFDSKNEVIELIGRLPKPLTMYIGSRKKSHIDFYLKRTAAGSTLINDFLLNFNNPNAPFGGINDSGIGKSGGIYSFGEFSNERAVMERRWASLSILYPPYTKSLRRIMMKFIKWK